MNRSILKAQTDRISLKLVLKNYYYILKVNVNNALRTKYLEVLGILHINIHK